MYDYYGLKQQPEQHFILVEAFLKSLSIYLIEKITKFRIFTFKHSLTLNIEESLNFYRKPSTVPLIIYLSNPIRIASVKRYY